MNTRWLNPSTNPALYSALIGIAYSIWQAIQVQAANGPLTWPQVGRIAAGVVFAAAVAWQRGKTTPVADPKDGNGQPLIVKPSSVINVAGDPSKQPAVIKFEGVQLTQGDIDRLSSVLKGPVMRVQPSATGNGPQKGTTTP
jgi:hypothetical protein